MIREHSPAPFVNLHLPGDLKARPLKAEVKSANARKQTSN
jgi:hypothetical protein